METSPQMKIPSDLRGVIDSGMCTACGACLAADPGLDLEMDPSKLVYRPTGVGDERAAGVCPAIAVDFPWLHSKVFPGRQVTPHGVVDSVLLAQSTDIDRNLKASSGGLIKEMLAELLLRSDIDGVIALDEVAGLEYRERLVTDIEDVDRLPGSIYHAVRLDDTLRILREQPGRYVLVGIPCQFEGLYTYIHRHEPELADRIALTVGLLCGWLYSHHSIRAISQYKKVDPDDITHIAYRGGGPVGKLRMVTPERTVTVGRRVDFSYQVAFDRSFNNTRCHVCVNHSNFLADIVVGDAWLPSTVTTRSGISLLICRTPEARSLVDDLEDSGRIVLTEASVEEITESQTHRVVFGDFAYAYADYRRALGLHTPDMFGPNHAETRPAAEDAVAHFHKELVRKQELQARGDYRFLWWRKATKELPRHLKKYLDWFLVRVLRIKSLKGERQELSRDDMAVFR
ncbi:MAG TPA: hypothetical protein ENI86_02875 [Acidimicrobiales bacterium]|nr:hypothetical protein [Acidimicrobiales bacterium]